jgi:glycine hydroxymethyltransferase
VNKNAVPNDPQSPFVTSGIRIGTPSITTRGFKESESTQVANWICEIINNVNDGTVIGTVRDNVSALCKQFPMYES